jgi:hypothetical protein
VQLELKGLSSIDLPDAASMPEDPSNCSMRMAAAIGAVEDSGADLFYFSAATPTGARRTRGILIVDRFSWETVEKTLRELIADASSRTWEDATRYLNTHLVWEFDDE